MHMQANQIKCKLRGKIEGLAIGCLEKSKRVNNAHARSHMMTTLRAITMRGKKKQKGKKHRALTPSPSEQPCAQRLLPVTSRRQASLAEQDERLCAADRWRDRVLQLVESTTDCACTCVARVHLLGVGRGGGCRQTDQTSPAASTVRVSRDIEHILVAPLHVRTVMQLAIPLTDAGR